MRAVERRHSEGHDDERLVAVALEHLRRYHPRRACVEERVREIVTARAYEIEYAAVYAGNLGTEEASPGTIDPGRNGRVFDRKPWDLSRRGD